MQVAARRWGGTCDSYSLHFYFNVSLFPAKCGRLVVYTTFQIFFVSSGKHFNRMSDCTKAACFCSGEMLF